MAKPIGSQSPRPLLLSVALIAAALVLSACADVRETTLANGLKVIVKEDHRAPVVVTQIWYKVGSVDEPPGQGGISHVLEHMMFKGTAKHPPGEFSRIIAENGGRENAFTGRDYTAYFQQLEKSRLPISFELEADRMHNLKLAPEELKKEVQVVLEERRLRTDDKPQGRAYEEFMYTAYRVHPYRNPIIGTVKDLESLTLDQVQAWYRRWYVPNNATLVVVGDVDPRDVFALAKKYFGAIPRGEVKRTPVPAEPPQREPRRAVVKIPAELPYFVMGFHVPALTKKASWEPYALDVLAGVLDGGASARFARELVRGQQLATGVSADYGMTARYPTLFGIDAVPAQGRTVAEIDRAIWEQIERVKRTRVSDAELARIKAQVTAGEIYGRDSVFNQAMIIGMLETVGLDWRLMDKYAKRIADVTPEQVQQVAQKYLTENNMTAITLDPQPLDPAAAARRERAPAAEASHGR